MGDVSKMELDGCCFRASSFLSFKTLDDLCGK